MMRRVLIAAALVAIVTSGASAQFLPTIPPGLPTNALQLPSAVPTLTPSVTPTTTATDTSTATSSATAEPSATATATPTASRTPRPSITPTPTETIDPLLTPDPMNIEVATDVLFPAGIAFRVRFRWPEGGVRAITMAAAQEGWAGQTLDMNPLDVLTDENRVSTLYSVWDVAANPPRLFEPLAILWTVYPNSGPPQSAQVETVFADGRLSWMLLRPDGTPVELAIVSSRTQGALLAGHIGLLAELLDQAGRVMPTLRVAIFPPGTSTLPCDEVAILTGALSQLDAPCDNRRAQALYEGQDWKVFGTGLALPAQSILTAEVTNAAFPSLYGSADVPGWFKDGLTAYLSAAYTANDLETARAGARSNRLLPSLDSLAANDAETGQRRIQSTGAVVYMASQVGVRNLLDVAVRVDGGEPLADVWLDVSEQSLDALLPVWRNWIFTPRAEAAYASGPSLAPTVTLVPTRTPSATSTVTSTFTPSATPTVTPTETSTEPPTLTPVPSPTDPVGFALPTAAASVTPTITPPPTVTPRAAETFSLEPTSGPLASIPLERLLMVAGIAAGALVVLGAIVIFIRRR